MAAVSVTPAATAAPTVSGPKISPAATARSTADAATEKGSAVDDALRYTLVGGVLLYGLYVFYRAVTLASRRKARVGASGLGKSGAGQFASEPEKIETPR